MNRIQKIKNRIKTVNDGDMANWMIAFTIGAVIGVTAFAVGRHLGDIHLGIPDMVEMTDAETVELVYKRG